MPAFRKTTPVHRGERPAPVAREANTRVVAAVTPDYRPLEEAIPDFEEMTKGELEAFAKSKGFDDITKDGMSKKAMIDALIERLG